MQARSYADLYASAEERDRARRKQEAEARMLRGALESTATATSASESSGFQRMAMCRKALEALDRRGWDRSYHQRYFHDNFIRACARVFWKVRVDQFDRTVEMCVLIGNVKKNSAGGARGIVCAGPPADPGAEWVGQSGPGGADLDSQAVREDDICVDVCCSDDLCCPESRVFDLFDLQADQPQAAEEH